MKIFGIPSAISRVTRSRSILEHIGNVAREINPFNKLEICDLGNIPVLDSDRYGGNNPIPLEADAFRNSVKSCDVLVIAAHECPLGYYYSITAPLQNAFDWCVYPDNVFRRKPIAIVGFGCQHASGESCYHVRQECIILGGNCLSGPVFPQKEKPFELRRALAETTDMDNLPSVLNNYFRAILIQASEYAERSSLQCGGNSDSTTSVQNFTKSGCNGRESIRDN